MWPYLFYCLDKKGEKEEEEPDKKSKKEEPEPDFMMIENPARVMPAQLKKLSLPNDCRYQPLKSVSNSEIFIRDFTFDTSFAMEYSFSGIFEAIIWAFVGWLWNCCKYWLVLAFIESIVSTKPAFTRSNSTMETPEQCLKSVQS